MMHTSPEFLIIHSHPLSFDCSGVTTIKDEELSNDNAS